MKVEFLLGYRHIVEFNHLTVAQAGGALYELAFPAWDAEIDFVTQVQVFGMAQQRGKIAGGNITASQFVAVGGVADNLLVQTM